jgi:hypothetical protein
MHPAGPIDFPFAWGGNGKIAWKSSSVWEGRFVVKISMKQELFLRVILDSPTDMSLQEEEAEKVIQHMRVKCLTSPQPEFYPRNSNFTSEG